MIVACWSAKGGVGKTSIALNLAATFADRGRRVLLVDLDPQATATIAAGVEPSPGLLAVMQGEAQAVDRIVRSPGLGCDVLAGSPELVGAERELGREPGAERLLAVALKPLGRRYDVVMLDAGPGVNLLALNALAAAQVHLAPLLPQPFAVAALPDTLAVADRVRARINRRLGPTIIVLANVTRRRLDLDTVAGLRARYGRRIARAIIPASAAVVAASARRSAVVTLRPSSPAALAFGELAAELIRRSR